jgi:metal-responsive CopG/Arc/MetJ family transcriptional regulator
LNRRINIILPEDTIRLLDRVSAKRERSALIDRAIRRYVEEAGKASLHLRLKERYEHRAVRDLETAEASFPLDEEAFSGGSR